MLKFSIYWSISSTESETSNLSAQYYFIPLHLRSTMQVSQKVAPGNAHVAVFAFPYHGRLPAPALFGLTTKLAAETPNTLFSFFGTAKSIHNLTKSTPSNLKTYSTLVDGLQPGTFGADKTPFSDALKGEAKTLLSFLPVNLSRSVKAAGEESGREVTCLVTDVLFASEVDKLAHEMDVPWVAFSAVAPHTLFTFFHLDLIRRTYVHDHEKKFPSSAENLGPIPGLSVFRVKDLSSCDVIVKEEEDKVSFDAATWLKENLSVVSRASAVVFGSFEELNPVLLDSQIKSTFKRVLYVGALTLSLWPPPPEADAEGCFSWLDKQNPGSVVYVSFGTEGNPPREEIVALAEGLQASGVPFLWSIKDDRDKENLPDTMFLNGKVVLWAPQRQILAHRSVAVCVSHGGYDSVMESIVGEVPMIVRPVWTDNKLSARLVTEVWEIGVRVEGDVFTKTGMIKSLEMVFGDHGKVLVDKVKALKEVVVKAACPSGPAATHFKDLVDIISNKN